MIPLRGPAPESRIMKIVTHYDPPPIPLRQFDWSAVDDDTYDGPPCPVGHGAALADLMQQMEEK